LSDLKVYGSLHIEMYVDVDVDRVSCIASVVKGVADGLGMEFSSHDMLSFYEKLKSLGAPEDLLKLFRDSNYVVLTLRDGGTSISLSLYMDWERKRINRITLKTQTIKLHRVVGSVAESLSNAVADVEAMQRALNIMKEVLDATKSCLQQSHSQTK